MESGAPRRGMRVLCPIHTPDPVPPPGEAVPAEANLFEAVVPVQLHRGCQGNEVFDTAVARDLAGCAYAAYHCVRSESAVRSPGRLTTATPRRLCRQASSIKSSYNISSAVDCRLLRRHAANLPVLGLQCLDMDVNGTNTAFLDREYFLHTVGAGLEVEVLGAQNIDDKLGVSESGWGRRSPCSSTHFNDLRLAAIAVLAPY